VTAPESAGPPFPAPDRIHVDAGVFVGGGPPPPGVDPLPPVFVPTHAVDVTLLDFNTGPELLVARLVAADTAGEFGPGDAVVFDLRAGYTNPDFVPVPINWRTRFDYRAYDGGGLGEPISPELITVAFDDDSFEVTYELDLAGFFPPNFEPVQRHTLAGYTNPEIRPVYRIADVRAEVGSLDLTVLLEPRTGDPISGAEMSYLTMTLTGQTAPAPAAVPEPASAALLAAGLAAARRRRRAA
jgi:hypothetical protein